MYGIDQLFNVACFDTSILKVKKTPVQLVKFMMLIMQCYFLYGNKLSNWNFIHNIQFLKIAS